MKKQWKASAEAALLASLLLVGTSGLAGGIPHHAIYMDAGGGSGKVLAQRNVMTVAATDASAQAAAHEQQVRAGLEALGIWVD